MSVLPVVGAGAVKPVGLTNTDVSPQMLARFDLNRDGRLDDQERQAMEAFLQARAGAGGRGVGSRGAGGRGVGGHHRPSEQELLAKFDVNGDGQLDAEEEAAMQAAIAAHRQRHQQRGAPGGFNIQG